MESKTKPEKRHGDRHFEPGFYQHYKGGIYYACVTALSNELTEDRIALVVYFSLEKGIYNTRPKDHPNYDSFLDDVYTEGVWKPRFRKMSGGDLLHLDVMGMYIKPPVKAMPTSALDEQEREIRR